MVSKNVKVLFAVALLTSTSVFAMEPEEPNKMTVSVKKIDDEKASESNLLIILPEETDEDSTSLGAALIVHPEQDNGWGTYFSSKVSSLSTSLCTAGLKIYESAQYVGGVIHSGYVVVTECIEEVKKQKAIVNRARREFRLNGVDLYLYTKDGYRKLEAELSEKFQLHNTIQITVEFHPPVAIMMQAFASKFGPNFGMLLQNMNRIATPKIAAQLAKKLGLTQLVGEFAANKMLALSNPLGWGATILSAVDMGSTVATTLIENNLLKQSIRKMEELLEKKFQIVKVREEKLKLLAGQSQYSAQINDEAADSKQMGKALFSEIVRIAQIESIIAAYNLAVQGLPKTIERTLHSFTADCKAKIKELGEGPHIDFLAGALHAFILGPEEGSALSLMLDTLAAQKPVTEIASTFNSCLKKPFSTLKSFMPTFVTEAVNNVADGVNEVAGETAGKQLAEHINDQYFKQLQDLKLFSPEQMKLNLAQHIEALDENVQSAYSFANGFMQGYMKEDLESVIHKVLHNGGTFAAEYMLNLMAEQLQPILALNNINYDVQTLMTQEVVLEQNVVEKAASGLKALWNWGYWTEPSDNDEEEI